MALWHRRQLRLSNPCLYLHSLARIAWPGTTENGMPVLKRPLYQHSEGADEDRWRLVFDTDANRLFVEHESKRGDTRGSGYGINTEEIELAAFLSENGHAQQELTALLNTLFEARNDAPQP
jgi:hypothetical protein